MPWQSGGVAREDGKPSGASAEPSENRFLRPVTTEERESQARAVEAARATFSKPRDRQGSTYFCADGLTPEETSGLLVEEMMRVATILGMEAVDGGSLSWNDLELIHRGVFEPVFGEKALGFRDIGHPGVTYPVWEVDGNGKLRIRTQSGSAPKQIRRALDRTVLRLERDVVDLARQGQCSREIQLHEAVLPAVRVYARIIAVHPWEDGNGRTAWLVLNHALIRCGVLAVATDPSSEARLALGRAITTRRQRDLEPLADLLVQSIRRSL